MKSENKNATVCENIYFKQGEKVMKRIIAIVLCIALCSVCVIVGVQNRKENATPMATAPITTTGTQIIGRTVVGADTNALPQPSAPATGGTLKATDNGYELTGNITVSNGTELAEVETALNQGKTFDGKGFTVTIANNSPLFTTLSGGTVTNLVVAGNTTDGGAPMFGAFVRTVTGGTVTFENVVVCVNITATVDDTNGIGGFIGNITNATVTNPDESVDIVSVGNVIFNNCMFDGKIAVADNTLNVRAGGFVGKTDNNSTATLNNCTSSGEFIISNFQGGFFSEVNGDSDVEIKNSYSDSVFDWTNASASFAAGAGGFVGNVKSVTPATPTTLKISNSISDATMVVATNASKYIGGFLGGSSVVGELWFTDCVSNMDLQFKNTVSALDGYFGGYIGLLAGANASATPDIRFTNCENNTDFELAVPTTASTITFSIGGFIGRNQNGNAASANMAITMNGCENNGDIFINSFSYVHNKALYTNLGGFVGFNYSQATYNFNNCKNNGNITDYAHNTGVHAQYLGGFIACSYTTNLPTLKLENCENNGNISAYSRTQDATAGGFFGYPMGSKALEMTDCTNTGDITVIGWDGYGHSNSSPSLADIGKDSGSATAVLSVTTLPQAGGFAGAFISTATTIENCANYGNVTVENQAKAVNGALTTYNNQARAGGFISTIAGPVAFNECINVGNISLTAGQQKDGTIVGVPAGGFSSVMPAATTLTSCVNVGDISSNSTFTGALAGYYQSTTVAGIKNCVNLGKVTDSNGGAFIHLNVASTKVASSAFTNCYSLAGTVDNILYGGDFVEVSGATGVTVGDFFTVTEGTRDGSNFVFGATFNKEIYDIIESAAGAENVSVGGIVTNKSIADVIGRSFDHETYDGIAIANGKPVGYLYRSATFKDGRVTQSLGVDTDDVVEGNYSVNVILRNAEVGETYVARTFIKIGSAYVYSK